MFSIIDAQNRVYGLNYPCQLTPDGNSAYTSGETTNKNSSNHEDVVKQVRKLNIQVPVKETISCKVIANLCRKVTSEL